MSYALQIAQIILSILLIVLILLQQRGGGLSATFGGSGTIYGTRRGMEKTIFRATIVAAALFLAVAFFNIIIY